MAVRVAARAETKRLTAGLRFVVSLSVDASGCRAGALRPFGDQRDPNDV